MTIREAIIKIVQDGQNFEIYSKICTVKPLSVDKELNVCDVIPVDGDAELLDVKLTATESDELSSGALNKGFISYPVEGSIVIVTFIDKDTAFVSMCTEVEEVVFRGGVNGGLINIETLILELNKNNAILNAVIDGFSTFVPVPEDGGAALKTLMNTVLGNLPVGDFTQMEDETFKH